WSASQRFERLKLIVQNRRFLVLAPKGESPNLASQAMGAALRVLPEQRQENFGYVPLLAESFNDPEAYAGTCYKASNWEAVGYSAGYSRHRADFYLPNERPKRLWLRSLAPDARQVLRSGGLPEDCRAWTGSYTVGNTAGQRRATGVAVGGVSTRSGPARFQHPLSHRSGADDHCDGVAGRATGDCRDRPLCHNTEPTAALPPGAAAQEGHPRLLQGPGLRSVLSGAQPHGSRSLRRPAHRLASKPCGHAASGAGAGRQNDSRSYRTADSGPT